MIKWTKSNLKRAKVYTTSNRRVKVRKKTEEYEPRAGERRRMSGRARIFAFSIVFFSWFCD